MAWPEEPTDTVIYEEKELIADKNLTLRMIDGAKVNFIGEVDIFSDVDITGDLSVNGEVDVNGSISTDDLTASGNISTNNLTASGDITANDLTASGNITAAHLEVRADADDHDPFQIKRIGDSLPRLTFTSADWLGFGGGTDGPDIYFMRLGAGWMQVQGFLQFMSHVDVIGNFAHKGTYLGFYDSPGVTKPTGVTAKAALEALGLGANITPQVNNVQGVTGIWSGTQAAYDGLGTKDPNTLYFIT